MHMSLLSGILAVVLSVSAAQAAETLTVAATPVPHAEILELIKPQLARQGVELDIKVFTDYVQPNLQVEQKRLDANYFQTRPYLDTFNKDRGTHLVILQGVHVEPFGGYSRRYASLAQLPEGATIALPNDVSTSGRALLLLQKAGLLTLKDPGNALATPKDLAENPHGFTFRELEAAMLPRVLDQVDLALINTNYALEAGLNPTRDALVLEDKESPYVNYLVARPDNRDSDALKKLAAALTSPEVRAFIETRYGGAVIPAF